MIIDEVGVAIVPEFEGFAAAARRGFADVSSAFAEAGDAAGRRFSEEIESWLRRVSVDGSRAGAEVGREFGTSFDDTAGRSVSRLGNQIPSQMRRAGQEAGGSFGEGFNRDVNDKLRGGEERFASEGRRSGRGFLSGFRSGSGGSGAGGGLVSGLLGSVRGAAGPMALAVATLGVGQIAKDAVTTEASFSKTMRTMAATAGVPAPEIAKLSELALKMGNDTVFSANDAAGAMLELAKAGIAPADIEAGALQGTLTLAAAAGTDLGTASTIAANAMNEFSLRGKDMNTVAAALAGGANASTASVQSLGEALGQVGPGARTAGLTLNDTVGVLAAFDQAGIKGTDAGTSLKTMLVSLVPQTNAAKSAMRDLGLKFTDAHGKFLPITSVAQELRDKLSGLSQEAKTTALSQIFGSDASRAAAVLANLGSKGLTPFIQATKDAGAAQRTAQAAMGGTSGALERLQGSFETAKLRLGQFLAPAVISGANLLGEALNTVGPAIGGIEAATQLLVTGDFNGGIGKALGLQEDSPLVADLLETRSALVGIFEFLGSGNPVDLAEKLGVGLDSPVLKDIQRIRDTVIGLFDFIGSGDVSGELVRALGVDSDSPVIGQLQAFRKEVLDGLGDVESFVQSQILPGLASVGASLLDLYAVVAPIIGQIVGAVIGGFGQIEPYVREVWSSVGEIIVAALAIITTVIRATTIVITELWSIFGQTILAFVVAAFKGIYETIAGVMKVIAGVVKLVLALIRGDWSGAWDALKEIVSGVWQAIRGIISLALTVIKLAIRAGLDVIRAIFSAIWSGLKSVVSSAWDGIKSAVSSGIGGVVSLVASLPGKVSSALGDLGSLLYSAGQKVISGLLDGIRSRVGAIKDAMVGVVGDLTGAFQNSPAKYGPLKAYPLERYGANVPRFIADGMRDGAPLVSDAAESIAARMRTTLVTPSLGDLAVLAGQQAVIPSGTTAAAPTPTRVLQVALSTRLSQAEVVPVLRAYEADLDLMEPATAGGAL